MAAVTAVTRAVPLLPAQYRHLVLLAGSVRSGVWQAWDAERRRFVAIKQLHPESLFDSFAVQRFRDEAAFGLQLSSPYVIETLELLDDPEGMAIVMECVDGISTLEWCARRRTAAEVLAVAIRLAAALEVVHAAEIIHSDVKPSNLMLTMEGRVALGDFGIARRCGQMVPCPEGHHPMTVTHGSPEQIKGMLIDYRSDIYSACCTIYQWLTRQLPFIGEVSWQVGLQHCEFDRPSVRTVRPDVSEAFDALIQRGMAIDPNDRYGSASEFHAALVALRP